MTTVVFIYTLCFAVGFVVVWKWMGRRR